MRHVFKQLDLKIKSSIRPKPQEGCLKVHS